MADRAVVLKIYASRETDPGYSAASIVDALPAEKAAYAENFEIATQYLLNNLAAGDIVIVFSAGDATQLSQMVFTQLNQRKNEVSGTGS
jgi:UDP-N-acetylmuramate--alanine ligase